MKSQAIKKRYSRCREKNKGGDLVRDSEIIELFFARDEQAIAETDKAYGTYCQSIAMQILGNLSDSEECVNDTWLRAWNSIPPKRPSPLKLFLGKITRNLAISRYRADHLGRFGIGGGSIIKIDEFLAIDLALQNGKLLSYIVGIKHNSSFTQRASLATVKLSTESFLYQNVQSLTQSIELYSIDNLACKILLDLLAGSLHIGRRCRFLCCWL